MPNDLEVSLGSGGLKGMYQVGLFSALDNRHMNRINRCSGVSAGALTGACLVSPSPRATLQAYYRTALNQPLVPSGNKYWRAAKRYFGHKDSLYDGAIFENLVRDTLAPIAHNKVLDVGVKPLASRNQHSVQLTSSSSFDDVVQSVLASAAIMGVFPPRNLPSLGPCVDGGFISGLHLPRLRQAVQDRDSRVLMVVSCVPSCETTRALKPTIWASHWLHRMRLTPTRRPCTPRNKSLDYRICQTGCLVRCTTVRVVPRLYDVDAA